MMKWIVVIVLLFCWDAPSAQVQQLAKEPRTDVFRNVDEEPAYPGGSAATSKFLIRNTQYPRSAQEEEREGTVYVKFVVSATGAIEDVEVASKKWPDLDAEAVRVVKAMPKWKPARYKGKDVAAYYTFPINFRLK